MDVTELAPDMSPTRGFDDLATFCGFRLTQCRRSLRLPKNALVIADSPLHMDGKSF